MKKITLLLKRMCLLIVAILLAGAGFSQTLTNEKDTVTWVFDAGTADQAATYYDGTYFKPESVTLGSNLSYNGTETGSESGYTFTKFTPTAKNGSATADDIVSFNVTPSTGLTFTPTHIYFNCERFGTGGGLIDVVWKTSDGTETTIATGIKPERKGDDDGADEVDTYVIDEDVSGLGISASDDVSLQIYIYSLDNGRNVGLANIQISGVLNGTVIDIPTYSVGTSASPEAGGSVDSDNASTVDSLTVVSLTAIPAFGYEFTKWQDGTGADQSTDNPLSVKVISDTNLVAVFSEVTTYSLDVTVDGGANDYMVSASPNENSMAYEDGDVVTLTAASNDIMTFDSWSTGATDASIDVTMDADQSITAYYTAESYIVGWDFYVTGSSNRAPAFTSTSENDASALICRTAAGATSSWLDKSEEKAGGYEGQSAAVNWNDTTDRYYFQINFNAARFGDIVVSADLLCNYNAFSTYYCEYSLDNSTWTSLGTYTLSERKVWYNNTFTLPSDADNASNVYVRWIPDYSSAKIGTPSTNDGIAISDIYVTGTENVSSSLVAYWKFDEGADTLSADEFGTSDGGLINSLPESIWVDGYIGKALDFTQRNTDDTTLFFNVDYNETLAFDSASSFSFSVIVKSDLTSGSQTILGEGIPFAVSEDWIHLGSKDNTLRFTLYDGSQCPLAADIPDDIAANEWMHIVVVYNGDTKLMEIYLNGELLGSMTSTLTGNFASTTGFYVGAIPGNSSYYFFSHQFQGLIDETQAYNTALSAEEVEELAINYGFKEKNEPSAYYTFDEVLYDTLYDEVGFSDGMIEDSIDFVEGYVGNAITFDSIDDGTSHIVVPHTDSLNLNGCFTISGVVRCDDMSGSDQFFFYKGHNSAATEFTVGGADYTSEGYWIALGFKANSIRFFADDNATNLNFEYDASERPVEGEWVHIVGVRDTANNVMQLYLNGVMVEEIEDVRTAQIDNDLPLIIGNHPVNANPFIGAIDEIQVFKKALSADDIADMASGYGLEFPYKDNSDMGTLTINDESQFILGGQTSYSYDVAYGAEVPTVVATASDTDASVEYDVASDLTDSTKITITAENGVDATVYWVVFNVEDPSTDASLSDISVNVGTLTPSFVTTTKDYTDTVPNATSTVTVTATPTHSGATTSGDGEITLSSSETEVSIVVTAQDGSTTDTYTVTIVKSTVGFEDAVFNNTIAYFNADELIIKASVELTKVELFDISGRAVLAENVYSDEVSINVSGYGLKSSAYFVRLYTDNNVKTIKLVK